MLSPFKVFALSKKKVLASLGLMVAGAVSLGGAVAGFTVANPVTAGVVAVATVSAVDSGNHEAKALTQSGSRIIVETADVDLAMTAAGDYSATTFESLKFLGVIALIAGATYILDKIFSILPRGRSAG